MRRPGASNCPSRNGKPLALLTSIDLVSIADIADLPWLPNQGRLLFFHDIERQPWGFDPKDREGWAVLYSEDTASAAQACESVLPQRCLSFRRTDTYPSWERPEIERLQLTDLEAEVLDALCTASYGEAPPHQIGEYPCPIQSDSMELECQLVSHGLYCGDASGHENPRAAELEAGAKHWRLLLQVTSDDDLGSSSSARPPLPDGCCMRRGRRRQRLARFAERPKAECVPPPIW